MRGPNYVVKQVAMILFSVAMLAIVGGFQSCRYPEKRAVVKGATSKTSIDNAVALLEKILSFHEIDAAANQVGAAVQRLQIQSEIWAMFKLFQSQSDTVLKSTVIELVKILPQTKNLGAETQAYASDLIYQAIQTEIKNRGTFVPWEKVEAVVEKRLISRESSDANFLARIEELAGHKFMDVTSQYEILKEGREDWEKRAQLIRNAQKSIWIFSWAFYNDNTGKQAVDDIIAASARRDAAGNSIDIRIVVDGPVSERTGYTEQLQRLEANGVQVMRWQDPSKYGFGMHRKIMIIDHNVVGSQITVLGGKNFGDNYSHLKEELPSDASEEAKRADQLGRWRDTDIKVTGPFALQAAKLFAEQWNRALKINAAFNRRFKSLTVPVESLATQNVSSKSQMVLADQNPSSDLPKKFSDPIYLATLKMVNQATRSIDISNAYFILTDPLYRALKEAVKRGVKVRVHCNSKASMDQADLPLLGPIGRSLKEILHLDGQHKRAEVYLQSTRTLHSKYLVVDSRFGWIGSYNIHPRSSRYESESVGIFFGDDIGSKFQAMFDRDIADGRAQLAKSDDQLQIPESEVFEAIGAFLFEQL
jgi:cardiolipin synthase A/B